MQEKKNEREAGLAEDSPHYFGHRARLRERFREAGADALSDYDCWKRCCSALSRDATSNRWPRR